MPVGWILRSSFPERKPRPPTGDPHMPPGPAHRSEESAAAHPFSPMSYSAGWSGSEDWPTLLLPVSLVFLQEHPLGAGGIRS